MLSLVWCYKVFFEDVNTLYEKYKYCSFWYELSYDDIVDNVDCMIDFLQISDGQGFYRVNGRNNFCKAWAYVDESSNPTKHSDEEKIHVYFHPTLLEFYTYELYPNQSLFFPIYIDNKYNGIAVIPKFAPISSMNIKQGALCLACLNISLTRLAPTPTKSSTNSEPLMK